MAQIILKDIRDAVIERDGLQCWYCGETINAAGKRPSLDHRTPRSKGGQDTVENLVVACDICNASKLTKTVDEFREFLRLKRSSAARAYQHLHAAFAEVEELDGFSIESALAWLQERIPQMRFYGEGERDVGALYLVRTEESRKRFDPRSCCYCSGKTYRDDFRPALVPCTHQPDQKRPMSMYTTDNALRCAPNLITSHHG